MNWFSELRQKMRRQRRPYRLYVKAGQDGISQLQDNFTVRAAWADITVVIAYKKDCFAVDDIRIVFSDGQSTVESSESQQTLTELNRVIKEHLPLDDPDWFERLVSSPPFDPTTTIVYKRPGLES